MKNIYFLIDNICRVSGYSKYKIIGDGFTLEYKEGTGYIVNYDTGVIIQKDCLEDIYREMTKLASCSNIKFIVTDSDYIKYNSLSDLFNCLKNNLIISFNSIDIYFIEGKFIRLLKNYKDNKTGRIYINDYGNLLKISGSNIRFVSKFKDIGLKEFIQEQGEEVTIIGQIS